MPVECEVVTVESAPTAVMKGTTTHSELHLAIGRLLDPVWEFLRGESVKPPLVPHHNIVLYEGAGAKGEFAVEVGVRVDRAFDEVGEPGVVCSSLPSGRAARAVHVGPYNRMRETYAVLEQWLGAHRLKGSGISWEIYGDHNDDPERLETEIYIQLQ